MFASMRFQIEESYSTLLKWLVARHKALSHVNSYIFAGLIWMMECVGREQNVNFMHFWYLYPWLGAFGSVFIGSSRHFNMNSPQQRIYSKVKTHACIFSRRSYTYSSWLHLNWLGFSMWSFSLLQSNNSVFFAMESPKELYRWQEIQNLIPNLHSQSKNC